MNGYSVVEENEDDGNELFSCFGRLRVLMSRLTRADEMTCVRKGTLVP